jgi:hypothetical protein
MRLAAVGLLVLVAIPAAAQKPWEVRVDLPMTVPIELPAVPPTNPFAAALVAPPLHGQTPLREKLDTTFVVQGAGYIDSSGTCRRVVFLRLPLPGIATEIQEALQETDFTPARSLGASVATWLPFTIDLQGRVRGGEVLRMQAVPPATGEPPTPDVVAMPSPDARDLALPGTPVEQLDQMPAAKRFRTRTSSRTWNQKVRLLAEVTPQGRCARVVFLSCPDGLRGWLLASLGGWTFTPAQGSDGPIAAWVQLDGELEVEVSGLESEVLRVSRQSSYPHGAGGSAAARPPGA